MNVHQFLKNLNEVCQFASKEQSGKRATNSELHRWVRNSNVMINGEVDNDPKEMIDFPIISMVLFPKSKNRVTLL